LGKAWPALDVHVPGCDPQLQELVLAELDDFHPTAIHEPDESARLRAFFTTHDARDAAARALGSSFGTHLFLEILDVEDDDWAARSQAQLRAVTVGRVTIAPPWDVKRDAEEGTRTLVVIIQPSMGFGTGHHATTRLMLKAMQDLPMMDRTVLDIGCGSGVLALSAVKLGALAAVGVDIDPDALGNAADNLELNQLAASVRFEHRDFRELSSPASAIVLANLTGALLAQTAAWLAELVAPTGWLIVSGFMESETGPVLSALGTHLTLQRTDQEDEWMCAVFQRPAPDRL
jgi:ribosomal protein L11 methyltransferase